MSQTNRKNQLPASSGSELRAVAWNGIEVVGLRTQNITVRRRHITDLKARIDGLPEEE